MKRIDRETVQRILDTADIVEVVSDFVSLKKRGSNYMGLCPFHNERTPSFSVSRSKRIYKCFSCGKAGSAVNFVMEHEQMSFNDALRYLAKKYNIEIKEVEMTDQERELASEREAMFAVNDFALQHFRHNLTQTANGRDIGLAYFRERGINDLMIERFGLGYALDKSDELYSAARARGFDDNAILATGLCSRSERDGAIYDRFRGRVIYPVHSVAGRVVAFGGRTLRSDKKVAKYVNSPESAIYNKSYELYGLYQAKRAINKLDKCILVEGYMDVISMHQAGIENVVASSGTSLTEGQVRLIHRFTNNVTLIYDSDAAGIKASYRGIDMLLSQGFNVKVLLLPKGEDPDSFAQHNPSSVVEQYIADNETDFMRFKTRILLDGSKNDPTARAGVINDIIRSIAVIPDTILRAEYIKECSRMLDYDEDVLMLQLKKVLAQNIEKKGIAREGATEVQETATEQTVQQSQQHLPTHNLPKSSARDDYEREVIKYIVRYGMALMPAAEDEEPMRVIDYVTGELDSDQIVLANDTYNSLLGQVVDIYRTLWDADYERHKQSLDQQYAEQMRQGQEKIRAQAKDLSDIETMERQLRQQCDEDYNARIDDYCVSYVVNMLMSVPDDATRNAVADMAFERYTLSKVHTRYAHVESERERLNELVPRAVMELKLCILNDQINEIFDEIKRQQGNPAEIVRLLTEQKRLYEIRSTFARYLGDRIVTPPKR